MAERAQAEEELGRVRTQVRLEEVILQVEVICVIARLVQYPAPVIIWLIAQVLHVKWFVLDPVSGPCNPCSCTSYYQATTYIEYLDCSDKKWLPESWWGSRLQFSVVSLTQLDSWSHTQSSFLFLCHFLFLFNAAVVICCHLASFEQQEHVSSLEEKLRLVRSSLQEVQLHCSQQKQTISELQAKNSQQSIEMDGLRRRIEELQQVRTHRLPATHEAEHSRFR